VPIVVLFLTANLSGKVGEKPKNLFYLKSGNPVFLVNPMDAVSNDTEFDTFDFCQCQNMENLTKNCCSRREVWRIEIS
jgi:hypothetical protein